MAWNQPGNENKDPWDPKKRKDGPPDLDDMLKGFLKKISGGSGSGGGSGKGSSAGGLGISAILIVMVAIWAISGFYTVKEQERALILRFGAYHHTSEAGIQWLPRGIDQKIIINIEETRKIDLHAEMLTQGANIVLVDLGVQYLVSNPQDYIFNLTDTDDTVRDVAETALRQVIGDSTLDDVITRGKEIIRSRTMVIMRRILDEKYKAGIKITNVTVGRTKPPPAVKAAFDDVISAQADRKKFEEDAEAYANREIPKAEGEAQRLLQAASAYSEKVVADAKGKVALYNKLLPEYEAAPRVTRRRLYLETMEQVLGNVRKVIVDKNNQQVNVMSLDAILSTSINKSNSGEKK